MIAGALLLEPAMLIADEPTSALDVTLQAQILSLLSRLRRTHGTAILFISHDLGLVAQLCDRVVVMYCGQVVESGLVVDVYDRPRHPYTRALLASIPSRDRRGERLAQSPDAYRVFLHFRRGAPSTTAASMRSRSAGSKRPTSSPTAPIAHAVWPTIRNPGTRGSPALTGRLPAVRASVTR